MPDYMFMLESRLSAEQRAVVLRVQELAAEAGSNVYLVGGAVRDLISGMPIRDLDFTIEGNPFRIARELEKGGAQVVREDERHRHAEIIFAGDVDGSIAAAREEFYHRPGTRPEIRFSTIMEDLRRRDFSLNAIAISLNPNSRGLLLDPTNGLADLEKHEVRALSIHSFTNQPVRLLRALRYCARLGFKLEPRTAEWFDLAMERGLNESIPTEDIGEELRQLGREDKAAATLKAWENRELIAALHPHLARRHPHYDMLARLLRAREEMMEAGFRPRMAVPAIHAVLARLKSRERSSTLGRLSFRAAEVEAILGLEDEAARTVKMLAGRKTAAPRDAFAYIETVPLHLFAYILAETSNSKARGKLRNYLSRWKPLERGLVDAARELESLGLARGPKFDKVIADLFQLQLLGKGRKPEDRTKLLRKLAGIKEPPKKKLKEEKKKPEKPAKKSKQAPAAAPAAAPVAVPPEKAARPGAAAALAAKAQEKHAAAKASAPKHPQKAPAAKKKTPAREPRPKARARKRK